MNWSKVSNSLLQQAKELNSRGYTTDANLAAVAVMIALATAFMEGNEQYHPIGGVSLK